MNIECHLECHDFLKNKKQRKQYREKCLMQLVFIHSRDKSKIHYNSFSEWKKRNWHSEMEFKKRKQTNKKSNDREKTIREVLLIPIFDKKTSTHRRHHPYYDLKITKCYSKTTKICI